jgi:hypothetical protein
LPNGFAPEGVERRRAEQGILGAKTQVIAQYGADSRAVELLGLKRKSARRRPTRRPSPVS